MVDPEIAAMFLEHSLLQFLRQFFLVYFKSVLSAHHESDNMLYTMFLLPRWAACVLLVTHDTGVTDCWGQNMPRGHTVHASLPM